MTETVKNLGFIAPDRIEDNEFVLGAALAMPEEELQPTGQWGNFLPLKEIQRNERFDTFNCTGFGTLNQIEVYLKRKYGKEENYSERFVGVMAETYPPGNTPQKVYEAIRKGGSVDDKLLPFDSAIKSVDEYYFPKPMTENYKKLGAEWLNQFTFNHEWVFKGGTLEEKQKALKEELVACPVAVSVYAWLQEGDYYIKPFGVSDTHWTLCFGYVDDKYWLIFDSYDNTVKKLTWNFNFGYAKGIYMEKIKAPEVKKNFFQKLADLFVYWLNEILR